MQEDIILALRNGQHAHGLALARAEVEATPQDPQAHRLLALALAMNGESVQAHAALDRAIALAPDDSSLLYQRATLLVNENRADEAREELDRTIGVNPNELRAYVMQAQLALGQGNLDEAERLARLAARIDPDHPWLLTVHGLVLLHRKQLPQAHGLIERASRLAPEALQTRYALGLSFLAQGHLAFAEQAFRGVLEMNPRAHGMRHMLADVVRGQNRHAEAAEIIEAGLVVDQAMPSDLLRYAGELWLVAGNHVRAVPLLKRAAAASPDDRVTLDALIEALRRQGDAADARHTLELALAAAPHIQGLWSARLSFEPEDGDKNGIADRWHASIPDSVDPLHVKMWRASQDGDKAMARAFADRIIEQDPGHIAAHSEIIEQLYLDDPPAAVAHIQSLLPSITDTQTMRMVLGWLGRAQSNAGQYADAVGTWMRQQSIIDPAARPLPATSGDTATYSPVGETKSEVSCPVFLYGPPGSGVERVVSTLLHNARAKIGIDRTSNNPPYDPLQFPDTALRLANGEIDGATVADAWLAALPARGLDASTGPVDWLTWWDNALLRVFRDAMPDAMLLLVLSDPRDTLLDCLQRDGYARFASGMPVEIATWLASVLEQLATIVENGWMRNRVVRIDALADDAVAIAAVVGEALDMKLSPAPALGPARHAAGSWRNYAEALAEPFALLTPVAQRLGYSET